MIVFVCVLCYPSNYQIRLLIDLTGSAYPTSSNVSSTFRIPDARLRARLRALSRRQRCFVVRFRRSRASAPALTRSAPASSASRARSTRPFSAPRSAPLPIASRTRDSLPLPPGEVRLTAYRSSRTRRRRMIWVSTDLTERSSWVRRRRVNRGGPRTGGRPAFAGGTLAHPGYFWNVSPRSIRRVI